MKINIAHLAKLASLSLSKSESELIEKQLSDTLKAISDLDEIDTSKTDITSQVTGLENILAEDKISKSLTQKEAIKNSKSTHQGLFKVDSILEN